MTTPNPTRLPASRPPPAPAAPVTRRRRSPFVAKIDGRAVRVEPAVPETIEARVKHALRLSRGTMPITIVVPDEATRARGIAILGRRGGKLIDIVTAAELRERERRP